MTFEIFKAFPPDRDGPVAELHAHVGDTVEIPIQMYQEKGQLRVSIFTAEGAVAWEFSLVDLIDGLNRAAAAIG